MQGNQTKGKGCAMDLISRQAAIDAVSRGCYELRGVFAECEKNLNELPSVQPEFAKDKNVPSNDCVSRQAAIDCVCYDQEYTIECLKKLPSAQPEREKGTWIQNDNGTYSCSLCQSWIPEEQYYYARFCLYCGADMRGEYDG